MEDSLFSVSTLVMPEEVKVKTRPVMPEKLRESKSMETLIRIDESKALIAPTREEVSPPPLPLPSSFSPSLILINMQCRNKALMSPRAD